MLTTNDEELALAVRRVNSLGYAGVGASKGKITEESRIRTTRATCGWVRLRIPELCAAVALGQLQRDELVGRRVEVGELLSSVAGGCEWLRTVQTTPPHCTNTYWTWVARLDHPQRPRGTTSATPSGATAATASSGPGSSASSGADVPRRIAGAGPALQALPAVRARAVPQRRGDPAAPSSSSPRTTGTGARPSARPRRCGRPSTSCLSEPDTAARSNGDARPGGARKAESRGDSVAGAARSGADLDVDITGDAAVVARRGRDARSGRQLRGDRQPPGLRGRPGRRLSRERPRGSPSSPRPRRPTVPASCTCRPTSTGPATATRGTTARARPADQRIRQVQVRGRGVRPRLRGHAGRAHQRDRFPRRRWPATSSSG